MGVVLISSTLFISAALNIMYTQYLIVYLLDCSSHRYTTLPLLPTDDFLAAHPEHSESSEHDLTVARIEHEHAGRKTLEEQRLQAVKRKEELVKEVKEKREELAKLDVGVEKWLQGQEGVRKMFEGRDGSVSAVV